MASSDSAEIQEKEVTEKGHDKDEKKDGKCGFIIERVKDLIHKIEEAIGLGKPVAHVNAIHIPVINLQKADIVVHVLVRNPSALPIPLIHINYLVESDGRNLVSGLISDAGTIQAHGTETVKIPINLIYDDITSTFSDIKPGSIIPYDIKVEMFVDVPIIGKMTVPLVKTGEIPIPHKPDIDLVKIKFEKFSFEETVATLHLKLDNKHDFHLGLKSLDYEVWIDDISIGGAELEKSAKLEKQGTSYLELPVTFRPKDFGSALWDIISGQGTSYSMKGNIVVDTPFGVMNLPISKEGGTTHFKKNKEDGGDGDEEG